MGYPDHHHNGLCHRFRRGDHARFGPVLKPVRPPERLEAVKKALEG
jgi:hypothetical protein